MATRRRSQATAPHLPTRVPDSKPAGTRFSSKAKRRSAFCGSRPPTIRDPIACYWWLTPTPSTSPVYRSTGPTRTILRPDSGPGTNGHCMAGFDGGVSLGCRRPRRMTDVTAVGRGNGAPANLTALADRRRDIGHDSGGRWTLGRRSGR